MPLSRREIRTRATKFTKQWAVAKEIMVCPADSLADLNDTPIMPPALVKAHQVLDKAVDNCCRPQALGNDAKRVEYLFELYEGYVGGVLAQEKPKRKKG